MFIHIIIVITQDHLANFTKPFFVDLVILRAYNILFTLREYKIRPAASAENVSLPSMCGSGVHH